MRDLAARIGTSQPFVSNIENGRIFPSLRTLTLLAEALDVSSDRLLPAPERVDSLNVDAFPRAPGEAATRRVLGAPGRVLQTRRLELTPGELEPVPHTHPGEEVVRVLRGTATLLRESEPPRPLAAGESLWIPGTTPHRLRAGEQGALVLIVATGAGEEAHA